MRWQAGQTQTVDPGPVRRQADCRGAALHAHRRGGQGNGQAAAVGIPGRQAGERPEVGRHRTGCAADAAIQRLGRTGGRGRILDAQGLRHCRAQAHVAEIHRIRRRGTGRSIGCRNRVRDGQGYRRQRRRIPGHILIDRRERNALGVCPGRGGVHRDTQALVAVPGRDHRQRTGPGDREAGDAGRRQISREVVARHARRVLDRQRQVLQRPAKRHGAQSQGVGVADMSQSAVARQ